MTLARTLALLVLTTTTAACAATTYDTSISSESLAPTTTVLPTGTAADLLPELVTESSGLSSLILNGGDKIATVERMEALWAAVHNEVTDGDRDLANEIDAQVGKSRAAATFNRPAAADKVYRNLKVLVAAYLALA